MTQSLSQTSVPGITMEPLEQLEVFLLPSERDGSPSDQGYHQHFIF